MRIRTLTLAIALAAACDGPATTDATTEQSVLDAQLRSEFGNWGVAPIAPITAQNSAMVDLGQSLFFDKILSGNRDISCGTCHDLTVGAIDGLSLSVGTGATGTGALRAPGAGRGFVPRNVPSVLNGGLGFYSLLWDGRVSRSGLSTFSGPKGVVLPAGLNNILAAQAMLPLLSRVEMRGNNSDVDVFGAANELATGSDTATGPVWAKVMQRVLSIQAYVDKFSSAYPSLPTASLGFQHAANAIAAYEMATFTKHNSPFDRYLARDDAALTADEKRGGILFFGKAGCASCHSGALMGGENFANVGIPPIGPGVGAAVPLDKGKGEQFSFYDFAFRVAPLRNVELTAPYMHNGVYPNLEAVLRHYSNPDSALKNYDETQLRADLRASHHGDATTTAAVLKTIDFRVRNGIKLDTEEQRLVVAFLKSLTDPAARNLAGLIPTSVPSGLPVK